MNEDLEMWGYWCGKYGPVEALEEYFPNLLKTDPVLQQAVAQVRVGLLAIGARMKELDK